jgi:ABC-type bacteriocin/lantibiotic exporter with double-glycine peptidase domain
MALQGHPVTYTQVKERIRVDPEKGCSLKSMREAATELGFPVEVRFVNPKLITGIPRPYIIHGKSSPQSLTGHFLVVVGYDGTKGTFDVIDPVFERFSSPKVEWVLGNFTGYTIIPTRSRQRWALWDLLSDWPVLLSTALVLAAVVANVRVGGRKPTTRAHG